MAGGEDAKWPGPVRRHFMPIGGEPLIERTVRQLRERGVSDVWIVAPLIPEYRLPGTRPIEPEYREWGHEALNGRAAWSESGRTIQVYGDTVFSDAAMDTITGFDRRAWQAFGRHAAGGVSRWGELFAISFWPEHHEPWLAALRHGFDLKSRGIILRAGSWEGYRIMAGAEGGQVARHQLYPALFTDVGDDLTDDFDTVEEYEALVKRWTS